MIGLVRELTRASLLAALWKPTIASSCLSRMKFSSVNALTMRMPCAVSCSDFIICIAPWNSLAMILRTRTPILRTPNTAIGTNMSAKTRQQRVLRHHDNNEPDDGQGVAGQRGDEEVEHVARRLGDERLAGDEFGRMLATVVSDLHPQHLVEDAPLDVGDDAVADPRQDDLLPVGREALDRVNDHDRPGDFPHRRETAADEHLIDDLADDPGRQRGGERNQAHHRKGEGVALPVLEALIGQEPAQGRVRGRVEEREHTLAGFTPKKQCFSPSPRPTGDSHS